MSFMGASRPNAESLAAENIRLRPCPSRRAPWSSPPLEGNDRMGAPEKRPAAGSGAGEPASRLGKNRSFSAPMGAAISSKDRQRRVARQQRACCRLGPAHGIEDAQRDHQRDAPPPVSEL